MSGASGLKPVWTTKLLNRFLSNVFPVSYGSSNDILHFETPVNQSQALHAVTLTPHLVVVTRMNHCPTACPTLPDCYEHTHVFHNPCIWRVALVRFSHHACEADTDLQPYSMLCEMPTSPVSTSAQAVTGQQGRSVWQMGKGQRTQ